MSTRPDTDSLPSVLDADPPAFTEAQAAEAAANVFGATGTASAFGSERDQNFLIDDGAGGKVVCKISNAVEDPAVLDMETAAALHALAADPDLPIARPLPPPGVGAAAGPAAYRGQVEAPGGGPPHFVRLFEYRAGRGSTDPLTLDLDALWGFGAIAARLGRSLRGFFHPAAGRVILWDAQHAASLRPFLPLVPDPERRALAERSLDRFEARVVPAWPRLRTQVIHGDLTLDNALLDDGDRVSGIVDFGDMSHSALVCDLTSAMASLLPGREGEELIQAGAAVIDGFESISPLEDEELALLPDVFIGRCLAAVGISAVRVDRYPDNEYIRGWDEESWPLLRMLDGRSPSESARILGAGRPWMTAVPDIDGLRQRRSAAFGPALSPLTYERPLHLVRGEGVWLIDAGGRRFLDVYNNVPVIGHSHPRVTSAIARQSRLLNTNMRYVHETAIELAERLVASMPEGSGLDTVMLVNSGSEANDTAWRLARAVTGRDGAVVTTYAYHGVTSAIADLSPEEWLDGSRPPHVETIAAPDTYRGPSRDDPVGAARELIGAIERLAARDRAPAVVMIDGGFTSDGVFAAPPAYFQELVRIAHDAGALYVADEVQAGHGRTGEHLWSFAAAGIVPDVVTLGKPMGNGHPVAAAITRRDLVERFAETTEWFSTFGGNPVAAAAGLAVLDVIEERDLVAHAARVGAHLRERIAALAEDHPVIGDVRGWGLLNAVELVGAGGDPDPGLASWVQNGLRERGVLVGTTGASGNTLKVRPPLVFTEAHADVVVDALRETLDARSD